jgi:hypothetical protein
MEVRMVDLDNAAEVAARLERLYNALPNPGYAHTCLNGSEVIRSLLIEVGELRAAEAERERVLRSLTQWDDHRVRSSPMIVVPGNRPAEG